MTGKENDWITLHRVRFETPKDGTDAPLSGPDRAKAWRFYPSSPQNEKGLRSNVSDVWGGFGLYDSRDAAEADLADMGNLAWMERTVERWQALAVPINHHGTTNWRGELSDSTISCAATDPSGRLVALTSAGYTDPGPDDLPRISDFLTNVDRVTQFYRSLPGNLVADVFAGAGVDGPMARRCQFGWMIQACAQRPTRAACTKSKWTDTTSPRCLIEVRGRAPVLSPAKAIGTAEIRRSDRLFGCGDR
jgi:hypothetical protein